MNDLLDATEPVYRDLASGEIEDIAAAWEIERLSRLIMDNHVNYPRTYAPRIYRLARQASDMATCFAPPVSDLASYPEFGGRLPQDSAANINGMITVGLEHGSVFWPGLNEHIIALANS